MNSQIKNLKVIFQKTYDGESLVDLSRDTWECLDAKFNPIAGEIPVDKWGLHTGTFKVTIEWVEE